MQNQTAEINLIDAFERIPVEIFPTLYEGSKFAAQQVAEPVNATICPNVYQASAIASFAMISSGAAVLVLSGVMLTVDEVRVGKDRGHQAMLTWTFRFR